MGHHGSRLRIIGLGAFHSNTRTTPCIGTVCVMCTYAYARKDVEQWSRQCAGGLLAVYDDVVTVGLLPGPLRDQHGRTKDQGCMNYITQRETPHTK